MRLEVLAGLQSHRVLALLSVTVFLTSPLAAFPHDFLSLDPTGVASNYPPATALKP